MYQTRQSDQKFVQGSPARQRLVAPMVALTIVLRRAPPTMSARASRNRSRVVRKPRRWSSHAPTTASNVFPTAIPPAVQSGWSRVALARKAPRVMPGQARGPSTRSAASAMPVGGQTTVTCLATKANLNPSFAAAK